KRLISDLNIKKISHLSSCKVQEIVINTHRQLSISFFSLDQRSLIFYTLGLGEMLQTTPADPIRSIGGFTIN
ncbi:MAG: hypothetical protein PVF86_17325, partial [Desulfobacterales bacterium]